ncbi:hypothetical protein V6N12_069630 [Hibiscus sabdariffa]|uniref:hAT-like transposase RNase-H fold domain-containing protein n=1 Tax=Hibiscus sabdariffa TaxID=183260 RepID=A0ABR2FEE1_9ROSI
MKLTTFQDVARKELAKMIIMHDYPLSIVDDEYFRNYCYSLQPMFDMPSRTTIRRDILDIYEEGKVKTMSKLEANEGQIAIRVDIWTVDHQNKEYMVVTVHYIDNSWTLRKHIIRFECVPTPYTVDFITSNLMKCFVDWNIDRKLVSITVDNCSVNDGIVGLLVDRLGSGVATLLDPRYKTLLLEYYFEDTYGVAAESEVEKIVQLCRNLVKEYQEKMVSRETGSLQQPFHIWLVENDDNKSSDMFGRLLIVPWATVAAKTTAAYNMSDDKIGEKEDIRQDTRNVEN